MLKRERQQVERALQNAKRALRFVDADRTVVCQRSRGTTTIEYANRQGEYLTAINKQYGSDLTGLSACIVELERLLDPRPVSESL